MYLLFILLLLSMINPLYCSSRRYIDTTLTPLHQAAIDNNAQAITELIATGADIHAETSTGMTPLHFAIWYNYYAATNTLLQAGADALVQTSQGNATPWHFACRLLFRYDAFVACIQNDVDTQASVSTQKALHEDIAAQKKIIAERKALLEMDLDKQKPTITQKALRENEAAEKKLIAAQKALLKKSSSYSPLAIVCTPHVDCRNKSPEKIEQHIYETKRKIYLLINKGARIDTRTTEQLKISFGNPPYGPNFLEVDFLPFVLACHPLTKSCKKLPDNVDTLNLTAFTPEQKTVLLQRKAAALEEVKTIEASLKK